MEVLEELGEWSKVTHLVVEEGVVPKRTPKVMLAMCCASYVVTTAWLRDCLEAGEVLPVISRVDPKVTKHSEARKRIATESLERSLALREAGKHILSGFSISIFKNIAGKKAPLLEELQCMVEGAGGVWLGEGLPTTTKVDVKNSIIITSDPCTSSQRRELKSSGEGVTPKTTTWLFDTFMTQQLDI